MNLLKALGKEYSLFMKGLINKMKKQSFSKVLRYSRGTKKLWLKLITRGKIK